MIFNRRDLTRCRVVGKLYLNGHLIILLTTPLFDKVLYVSHEQEQILNYFIKVRVKKPIQMICWQIICIVYTYLKNLIKVFKFYRAIVN
jgi:hypothetical protein